MIKDKKPQNNNSNKMSSEIQKQFLLTSKIGNGNFSTVYLAKHIQSQEIVAVKTMKNHIPIAIKQAQILKKINHPNVIKIYKFQKSKYNQQALIVLQYLPQNILELYESQEYGLKEQQVKCILFQSCLGLQHIHKKGIIHRDIKPENIMINRNKAEVKLIDFGLAIQQANCSTDYVATRWYRAPQNLLGTKEYTVAIDIFSLGCVIVQLYLGNPLFPGANNIDQISKILAMLGQPTLHSWSKGYEMFIKLGLNFQFKSLTKKTTLKSLISSCSQGLTKLIEKMLILNPSKRITAQEILQDPYFKDVQKIIPPHVYDQYLADFKPVRQIMIKELPKQERNVPSKQRVRFLSEQKSFGAFSSFKSSNPISKLHQSFAKQKQKIVAQKVDSSIKKVSLENLIKECDRFQQSDSQGPVFKKGGISFFDKSHLVNEAKAQQSHMSQISDVSSCIKTSIEKYEKNIQKLSTSLNNIKMLKSSKQLQGPKAQDLAVNQTRQAEQTTIRKQTEMLSFRGFNQPKQKLPIKQTGANFVKKNPSSVISEQKSHKFPIKNKKVIEYLQKFQAIARQSQHLQNHKLQNSRSEPIIYQNIHTTPKKPHFIIPNSTRPFALRQMTQKDQNPGDLSYTSLQNQPQLRGSFYLNHNLSARNLMSQSFHKDPNSLNQSQTIHFTEPLQFHTQNPLKKSVEVKNFSNLQSPVKNSVIKFSSNHQPYNQSGSKLISTSQSVQSSRIINEQPKKYQIKSPIINQAFMVEGRSLNSSNCQNGSQTNFNTPSMTVSSNRPVQNKIKLISGRDNLTSNAFQDFKQSQNKLLSGAMSSVNMNKNSQQYQNGSFLIQRSRNKEEVGNQNLGSYTSVQTQRKQSLYAKDTQQVYPTEYQSKSSFPDFKTRQFKSLEQRQFLNRKSPSNSYQINPTQDLHLGYKKNYAPINQPLIKNQIKTTQKTHQTALSQLRESITGLTQSLNGDPFLSQRSSKSNNKNININLNLNIYEKKYPRKR